MSQNGDHHLVHAVLMVDKEDGCKRCESKWPTRWASPGSGRPDKTDTSGIVLTDECFEFLDVTPRQGISSNVIMCRDPMRLKDTVILDRKQEKFPENNV